MKVKKKRLPANQTEDKISLLLLLFTLSVVPLLVRVTLVDYPKDQLAWVKEGYIFFDVYSYIKSNVLVMLGSIGALILGYKIFKEKVQFFKSPVVIITLVGMPAIMLSIIASKYKYTSIFGLYERYEGALVLFSYFILFILAYKTNWTKESKDKFFAVFFISNLILSIIGVLQYFGHDPLTWSFIRPLITSFELNAANMNIDTSVTYRVIGQTLYNYNYVSFFATLSLPIFLTRTLYEHDLRIKLGSAGLSLLILFNVFGSSARGGMVGLAAGLVLWVVLNWKRLFSNVKLTLILSALLIVSFIGFELLSDGFVTMRFASIFQTETQTYHIKKVYTEADDIIIETATGTLALKTDYDSEGTWSIRALLDDVEVESVGDAQGNYSFTDEDLALISYHFEKFDESKLLLVVVTDGIVWPFINIDDTLYLKNIYGHDVILKYASSFGFEGREKAGSARGYIWSRTLPLVAASPIVGYGPDTFAQVFPQEDYIGKYYSYGTQNMIVDKAHNIYLQQMMNSGIINLIVYVALMALFIVSGLRKFIEGKFGFDDYLIPAIMVAITSYAVAGLFNDSSVHVAPVYWVMLGMGLSLVYKQKEKKV